MARSIGVSPGRWTLDPAPIGSGSFAIVWKATQEGTGVLAAVKEINTDKLSPKLQESLASEIRVLEQTQHHNIVRMLDLIQEPGKMFLVLEFCGGGDLGQYLRRYGRVSENTARYFMRQLAQGLKELHSHNVLHRDLKPQNLLLSDTSRQPVLKIADFGFARSLQPQVMAETLCGSPLYMAPEILQSNKYDAKADLWSVGTILHELLTGRPPFTGANHVLLLQSIERNEGRLAHALPQHLSPPCRDLILGLLRRDPAHRMPFERFFNHPFFAGGKPASAHQLNLAPEPFVNKQAGAGGGEPTQRPAARRPEQANAPQRGPAPGGAQGAAATLGHGGVRPGEHPAMGPTAAAAAAAAAAHTTSAPAGGGVGGVGTVDRLQAPARVVNAVSHPLAPRGTSADDEDDFVVVSESSSPESSASHARRVANAGVALPRGTGAHAPAGHAPSQSSPVHGSHASGVGAVATPPMQRAPSVRSPGGTSPGGAVATMAAVAAAGWQAVTTVARSMQHTGGTSQSVPKGAFFTAQGSPSPPAPGHTVRDGAAATGAAPSVGGAAAPTATAAAATLPPPSRPQPQRAASSAPSGTAVGTAAAAATPAGPPSASSAAASPLTAPPLCHPPRHAPLDVSALSKQVRVPEHLDMSDLVQRVVLLLTDSARQRMVAAANAELEAEEAAAAAAVPLAPAAASSATPEQCARDSAAARRRKAQAATGALPGHLLALYLTASRLVEAGMASALRGDIEAVASGGRADADRLRAPASSARRTPSAASADARALAPLKTHARALVAALNAGGVLAELQEAARSSNGEPCVSAPEIVLDTALRYGRAAAADELLGLFPSSVDGYARAADLLLFLVLPDVPGVPADVKPRVLPAPECERVHRYYAAVKIRQAACMATLNAQLAR